MGLLVPMDSSKPRILLYFVSLIRQGDLFGNISSVNKSLRANYENFNLGHKINIQGEGRREWEGGFAKV